MKLLVHFLLLLCTSVAVAQSAYKDGYIISLDKDTIYGKIDFRDKRQNFILCTFMDSLGIHDFKPGQIAGYGFNNTYFSSEVLDSSFVELLVKGRLNVYNYQQDIYLQKTGYDWVKVENEYPKPIRDKQGFRKSRWFGTLTLWLSDCEEKNFNRNATQRILVKTAVAYNICFGEDYKEFKTDKPWIKLETGFMPGLNYSFINFPRRSDEITYLAKNYHSIDPSVGVVLLFLSPRMNERLALQTGIHITRGEYKSRVLSESRNITEYHNTAFGFNTVYFPAGIRFRLNNPGSLFPMYLGLGLNHTINFNHESELNTEMLIVDKIYTVEGEVFKIQKQNTELTGGLTVYKSFVKYNLGLFLNVHSNRLVRTMDIRSGIYRVNFGLIIETNQR